MTTGVLPGGRSPHSFSTIRWSTPTSKPNAIICALPMKEAITETKPLVLDALLKIPANFYVVTEWTPLPADKARKEVNKRRRHFNMSKTGFVSQMGNDATKTNPRDVLVDESKQADIENLGDCLRALGDGQSL